jgi:hypothetical protein
VDCPRDGPPRPGHRPQMNSRESARLEVSESSTSLTDESHAGAADASVLPNYPHSRTA